MKFSKRYIVLAIVLAVVFVSRFQPLSTDAGSIGRFRGGSVKSEIWDHMIAKGVNGGNLKAIIDSKPYSGRDYHFYMDKKRSVMVPVSMLRDAMNCSVHIYNDKELLIEKHELATRLFLEDTVARAGNGSERRIASPMTKVEGELYVSLNDVSELMDYKWSFDYGTSTLTTADSSESATVIPAKYDLRKRQRVSGVRNQGYYGTCWAFAATGAMESALLPEKKEVFSVDHMSMSNSFKVDQYDGGEYTMGMAYLAAWQGPVYEKDDPYGDDKTNKKLKPVAHVQQMRIIDGKDFEGIKTAVFKYGGVQSSLYSNLKSSSPSSMYYDSKSCSYCYRGTEKPNHDVVIVGWDDSYPKENFPMEVEGDGAFICQNSWGKKFGEKGFFYVSYFDTNIGTHNVVYTGIEPVDNYDHIYQSDLCGWVGKMGYDKEDIYGANVFTAQGQERVEAASFYATGADTEYEVFFVHDFKNKQSFSKMERVATGTVDQGGYYTIPFEKKQDVEAGEKYAVVFYMKTPGSTHPLAIEYDSGEEYLDTIDLEDGEGYISYNGSNFMGVKEKQNCNLCIKAFSKNR